MNRLLMCLLIFAFSPYTLAQVYYRHLPFELVIKAQDAIIVDYNYAAKAGIVCKANDDATIIQFKYKGRQKCSHLPTTLESSYVPKLSSEHLADMKGQIKLESGGNPHTKIECKYLTAENIPR